VTVTGLETQGLGLVLLDSLFIFKMQTFGGALRRKGGVTLSSS
jgi:hypothetical protein